MFDAEEKPFDAPVTVEIGQVGKYRQIRTTREATDCLLTVWPLNRGPRHRDAVEACLKVLDGHRSTTDAKQAFIEAAKELDVYVPQSEARKRG